ncbi:MAG TPA: hypothetical protein VHR45_08740 [Thermoanaerobaculia bacterium]|nr:hypothetical protein [Thermoanaerobaculia bacterium]
MRGMWSLTLVLCVAAFGAASDQSAGAGGSQAGSPAPAPAKETTGAKRVGAVTAVDDTAKTFTCHWHDKDWTFKTTDKTTYWLGTKAATWSDVKVGIGVSVVSHGEGGGQVADKVTIKPPKAPRTVPP